jgi:chitin disaccharide deacetylase
MKRTPLMSTSTWSRSQAGRLAAENLSYPGNRRGPSTNGQGLTNAEIRCVVNADDFGMSPGVNSATIEMMEAGYVTSATIMANGEAFDQAIAAARKLPQCSFGAHLNVTEFAPLSKSGALRPIVDANGEFSGAVRSYFLGPALQQAIFEELQLQYDRVRQALGRVSHIDSHHSIHVQPQLFLVLARFIRGNRIRSARLTTNLYPANAGPGSIRLAKKRLWSAALSRICLGRTCDYFGDIRSFLSGVERFNGSTVEIMAHPGSPLFSHENEIIGSDWRARLDAEVEFVNYDAVNLGPLRKSARHGSAD